MGVEESTHIEANYSGRVIVIQTAKCIATPGKGILAADESTGNIGKHFSSINVENIEANRQVLCELLFTSPHAFRYLTGVIPTKSFSLPSPPPMATSTASRPMSARSPTDPKSKYQQLLFYRQKQMPLSSRHKIPENKVQGRVSQVWVRAYLDGEGNIVLEADSDSVLAKGI